MDGQKASRRRLIGLLGLASMLLLVGAGFFGAGARFVSPATIQLLLAAGLTLDEVWCAIRCAGPWFEALNQ